MREKRVRRFVHQQFLDRCTPRALPLRSGERSAWRCRLNTSTYTCRYLAMLDTGSGSLRARSAWASPPRARTTRSVGATRSPRVRRGAVDDLDRRAEAPPAHLGAERVSDRAVGRLGRRAAFQQDRMEVFKQSAADRPSVGARTRDSTRAVGSVPGRSRGVRAAPAAIVSPTGRA